MSDQNREAFEGVRSALDALGLDDIETCNANLVTASRRSIQGGEWIEGARFRERSVVELLGLLPSELFTFQGPATLVQYGLAMRHIHMMLGQEEANMRESARRLPSELSEPARAIRQRMLKVCDFYIGHLPHVQITLSEIRADRSFNTLDADLDALAYLYKVHENAVSAPSPYFKFTDRADAEELSRKIASFLDQDGGGREWRSYRDRLWTLMRSEYNEARRGVFFVFKNHEEEVQRALPSLKNTFRRPLAPEPAAPSPTGPPEEPSA